MIIVTGANGKLGRAIVERLLERLPAAQIGVSVRNPEGARTFAEQGVRVRRGEYDDPASLAHAFEGATQVLIVSAGVVGDAAVRYHRTAINAAKAAGAQRLVYTSHMGVSPTSLFPPMRTHAATEAMLRDAGVPFTSLRNGYYAETVPMLLGNAAETGELLMPEDGPVSWTTRPDLAEAAAIVLSEERFDGTTPALTATEAIDMAGAVAMVSEVTGRPIRRVVVPDDEYRARLVARGLPEANATLLLSIFLASRRGEFIATDPTLGRLLGRPPLPLRDVLTAAMSSTT